MKSSFSMGSNSNYLRRKSYYWKYSTWIRMYICLHILTIIWSTVCRNTTRWKPCKGMQIATLGWRSTTWIRMQFNSISRRRRSSKNKHPSRNNIGITEVSKKLVQNLQWRNTSAATGKIAEYEIVEGLAYQYCSLLSENLQITIQNLQMQKPNSCRLLVSSRPFVRGSNYQFQH